VNHLVAARLRTLLLLLFLPLLALVACGDDDETAVTCVETTECAFGESCLDGVCTARSCATSAGCPIASFCDAGSCTQGCQNTDDCYPDQTCTDGSCKARGCRDTSLDCAFGELCDLATGECYPANNNYCKPCVAGSSDAEQCGSVANICLGWGQYGDFCGVECAQTTDCPAGYDCIPVGENGNVITKQCITYCWLYTDDDSRATARPTPPLELPPLDRDECPPDLMDALGPDAPGAR
jgi:hypothetical protein